MIDVLEPTMSPKSEVPRRVEQGFTLLEILIAMIVLAVGGVSILSLFTRAVQLQYRSVIEERKASVLAEAVPKAQELLNQHLPTAEQPVPTVDPLKLDKWSREHCPRDFGVQISFSSPGADFPVGEGAVAEITVLYRDDPQGKPIRHILQRTVIPVKAVEESVSYKEEQAGKLAREGGSKDDKDR